MADFKEGIHTPVVIPEKGEAVDLEIRYDGSDVVEFYLDGKLVFSGDWSENFQKFFELALKKWK